jgi:ATP-binding cassette, subfamily B, bacterial
VGSIARILVFAKSLRHYYVAIALLAVVVALLDLAPPFLSKIATDEIVKEGRGEPSSSSVVIAAVVGMLAAGVLTALASNIAGYLGDVMAAKLRKLLSTRYFEHLMSLPQRYFDNQLTGTVINRLSRSITNTTEFMQMFSNMLMSWLLNAVFMLAVIFWYSWQLGLLVFAVYPIYFFLTLRTSKKWIVFEQEKNNEADIASGRFAETIGQVKVAKSFRREAFELRFFNRHFQKYVERTYPQSRLWHTQDVYRRLVMEATFFAILLYLIYQTYQGKFGIGTMVMLLQYIVGMRFPLQAMSFIVDQTQQAVAGSKDFFEVMEEKPESDDEPGKPDLKLTEGRIEFRDLEFSYNGDGPVLRNVNFTVEPKSRVAPVGESGQGKTTLTNLLMRLYTPTSGQILIDGQDITEVTRSSVRQHIGVVFQDAELFSGTIRDNISYGRPDASDEEVVAAAEAANAHHFISQFPDGYDTEIGERGIKLSGGQRQRVAIARAVLKDPEILILDEATNSLDSRSESLVQEALDRLIEGRTTIVIAHRLSTIADVDQVVTLRGGTVDEAGPPSELATTGGVYSQLLDLQNASMDRQRRELERYGIAVGAE